MQFSPRLTEPRRKTNQQPKNKCGCCALYSPQAAGSAEREPPLFLCSLSTASAKIAAAGYGCKATT